MILLTTAEAAERYRVSVATMMAWRAQGKGPPFVKLAGAVRYREQDLATFAAKQLRTQIGEARRRKA